jgi:nitrate/nitrite-specific signal transduction histidine kinase
MEKGDIVSKGERKMTEDDRDRSKNLQGGKAERIMRYFSHSQRFIEEILRENERLRYKVFHLEQEAETPRATSAHPGAPDENAEEMRGQLESMRAHFEALKRENDEFRRKQQDVERQNESLLNLYVSGYQLHSTIDQANVASVIKEILLNLLGAEIFCLWMVDQETGRLESILQVDDRGSTRGVFPHPPRHLFDDLARGEKFQTDDDPHPADSHSPIVCVPIRLDGQTVGLLAIFRLLVQKNGLSSLDHELLELLTSQAAAALIGAEAFRRQARVLRLLEAETQGP